jgi:hypothetical protein
MPFVDMEPAEQCALIEQQYREVYTAKYIYFCAFSNTCICSSI